MTGYPLISALRRHKAGVALIVVQIALTLAIVCNAVFVIGQRIERVNRPSGIVESGLVRISQSWVHAPSGDDAAAVEQLDALQRTDLAILRGVPGVQRVAAADSAPLQGSVWSGVVAVDPGRQGAAAAAAYYYGDEHQRATLGVPLLAGRDFTAADILHHTIRDATPSPVIIVSRPLAEQLFPEGDALGKTVYQDGKAAVIVGIMGPLQTPTLATWGNAWAYNSVLEPVRLDGTSASYLVRTAPGQEQAVMRAARAALLAANPLRVMPASWGVQSFGEIRAKAYRGDRGMALLMGAICVVLLGVTAAGIVGLTSFWVGQRRRQIGIRRALGARRIDILRYFQCENGLIAGAGVLLGVVLAAALNAWLMGHYEMARLPAAYVLAGVLLMLAIGQAAVFVPARRAAAVPPVVATRSV